MEPTRTILPVQVLRAVAALVVVLCHYGLFYGKSGGTGLPDMNFGEAGVDLFFVISGFVMVYSSEPFFGRRGGPLAFFGRRIVRIVPLYWLVTALYVVVAYVLPQLGVRYSADYIAASLAFIPAQRAAGDGLQPVVGQGWSLNYEMLFYVVFAIAIFCSRRTAVLATTLTLAAIVIFLPRYDAGMAALGAWANPIVFEFVLGMLVGLLYREGARLPAALGWLLFVGGPLLIFARPYLPDFLENRVIAYGLPATLAVIGATMGGVALSGPVSRALVLIGEASYALYLTHAIAVRGTLALIDRAGIKLAGFAWPGLMLSVLASIALAVATYYVFELPMTRALRKLLSGRRGFAHPAEPIGLAHATGSAVRVKP